MVCGVNPCCDCLYSCILSHTNADVIVGFQQAQYTFNESDGSVSVRVSRSSVVAQPFTVQVTGGRSPSAIFKSHV